MGQASPSPSSSEARSLPLSSFLRAFPAQMRSLLGEAVSSTGEVPGTLTQELRTQGKHHNSSALRHGYSVPRTRGAGAGKGPEKGSEGGRGME